MKFRHYIGLLLIAALIAVNFTAPMRALRALPDVLWLEENSAQSSLSGINGILSVNRSGALRASASDDETLGTGGSMQPGTLDIMLFDMIKLKSVTVFGTDEMWVVPGGHSIGVTLYTQGVLIVGMSEITSADGSSVSPGAQAGLQSGDYILSIDGTAVQDADQIAALCDSEAAVLVKYSRNGIIGDTMLQPVLDSRDNHYRLGLWIRNSTMGIGTLSFFDERSGWYAALGHAIMDIDTNTLLSVREGQTFSSRVEDVIKGEKGSPGELKGSFGAGNQIYGNILKNTDFGIYGAAKTQIVNPLYPNAVPVAYPQEALMGPAQLLTTLDDSGIRAFDCEIIRINPQSAPAAKGMVIKVTDPELLARTGGIVQGMSGSPLIQNGKLIGVVTHVFINDPTKGYCIYALWMLNQVG